MLAKITILTSIIFSVIYPLCFLISSRNPLKNNFHHFHLGLPCIIGAIAAINLYFWIIPAPIKIILFIWIFCLFSFTAFSWNKTTPNINIVLLITLIGLIGFVQLNAEILKPDWQTHLISILAGCIFCSSLFAMNLGHWYLNVHGLPIEHLKRASFALGIFLFLRLLWDGWMIFTGFVMFQGDQISLFSFMNRIDGFLLYIAIFFGTLFPFGSLYFVRGTLALKNTQATTGILYVLLCSIILGDMAYKYYLVKFGIPL